MCPCACVHVCACGGGCVCLCMHVHVRVCACVGVCMHARMTHFLASICLRGPVVACSIHVHGLSHWPSTVGFGHCHQRW